jgi:hypothetical protein
MGETAEQYVSRLASYVGGSDPLAVLADTPGLIARELEGLAGEKLTRRPAPEEWCVNEIVGHLLDDEIATAWRYRQMIENDGALLPSFNQDEWARLGHYAARPLNEILTLFRMIREWNLRMLNSLTPEEWSRKGTHAERGSTSVRELVEHMAGHDLNHLQQIRQIIRQP